MKTNFLSLMPLILAIFVFATLVFSCGRTLNVVMNAQNNSGENGTATLTETNGALQVDVVLSKSNDVAPQPIHFHPGRCGELGAPLATLPNTDKSVALQTVTLKEGKFESHTTLSRVTIAELLKSEYVINVHDSRDLSLYVACGNVKE